MPSSRARGSTSSNSTGAPIGRIVVNRPGGFIHIIDQAIVPDLRGRGIGTSIMAKLMDEADRDGIPVRLKVASDNDLVDAALSPARLRGDRQDRDVSGDGMAGQKRGCRIGLSAHGEAEAGEARSL